MRKWESLLEREPRPLSQLSGLLGILLIGVLDLIVPWEFSMSFFYLIPIAAIAWFGSKLGGWLGAAMAAVIWLATEMMTHYSGFFSAPLLWNFGINLGLFLAEAYVFHKFRQTWIHHQELIRTDAITGLANSRAFFELAGIELNRAKRQHLPLTIVYMDIDNFKAINDKYGHSVGDSLLAKVAEVINENIRVNDILARLGGDEFVILLPEVETGMIQTVLERLRKNLILEMETRDWPVTFSIGVVTFHNLPDSIDDMLIKADDMMYAVKKSGKNQMKQDEIAM